MPFAPTDTDFEQQSIKAKFLRETLISRVGDDSKAGALIDALQTELRSIRNAASQQISVMMPDSAEGAFLDMWLDLLGEERQPGEVAHASIFDQVVRFKVDGGTFGDLNGGADILISASSFVASGDKQDLIEGQLVTRTADYYLTEDVTLSAGDSQAWVSVIAAGEGQEYNIPAKQLKSHNFTSYLAYPNRLLFIENVEAIVNGEDAETDVVTRSRVVRGSFARADSAANTITSLANTVPGVSSAFTVPYYSGLSTLDLFVDTESFTVPTSILNQVVDKVRGTPLPGVALRVHPVERVGVAMSLTVYLKANLTQEETDSLSVYLRNRIYESILYTPKGASVNFMDLHMVLQMAHIKIGTIGTPPQPFDSLLIYRDGGRTRVGESYDPTEVLSLEAYERLFVEESVIEPISLAFILL